MSFPLRVVFTVFAAMTLIVGGDAAGRLLTQAGFSPFFVAWARFAVAAIVLLPFSGIVRAEWRMLLDWRLALRAALIAGGISCILTALKTAPMADVFAAFFIGPVVSFILSAKLLGERVTPLRSLLLLVSFVGVLIVVRPGWGMTPGIGWALAAGCFHGSYLVATRWLAGAYRPRFLLWSQLAMGAIILIPLGLLPGDIPAITPDLALLLGLSALGSAAGNLLLVIVNRTTPAGVVAPLIYSQLIAATGFGWLVFNEWPDRYTMIGLTVIIAAGVGSVLAAARHK